ncbi:MAG: type II toxin-antitoxin system RelE/ParE family toxin [Pseudomonadota bacterium]|nr:type II toxin-antitoxin system RelE/ParE family toxin [Pseudomonadota bacterium]
MNLVYARLAVADLQRLRAFIAEHAPAAAEPIAHELIQRIELLREFPDIGRVVDAAPDPETVRDLIFGSYIVRYVRTASAIIILRIWHHAQARG